MMILGASCFAVLFALAQGQGQVTPQGLTPTVNSELQFLTVGNLTATDNNNLFIQNQAPDLCNVGPSVWCQSPQNAAVCGVANDVVGVCGFSTQKCPLQTISQFCATNPTATSYVGGLSGSRAGFYGYAVLALFWAPSSCPATGAGGNGVSQNGFCTSFTGVGSHAANNLVLHGMWPDYGALYAADPQPPAYAGAYQGFPQYCYSPAFNGTACWVGGGLCTSNPNATLQSFSQGAYETCLRQQQTTQCLVSQATVNALGSTFATYAPGYVDQNTTFGTGFLDHEFNKHASCYGNYFTRNSTAFFSSAIGYVQQVTAPGASGATIASYAGGNISYADITTILNGTASPQCNNNCQLSEVWYCLGREAGGFTTNIVKCTTGNLAAQSCSQCTGGIQIPLYPGTPTPPARTTTPAPTTTTAATPAPTTNKQQAVQGILGGGNGVIGNLGGIVPDIVNRAANDVHSG